MLVITKQLSEKHVTYNWNVNSYDSKVYLYFIEEKGLKDDVSRIDGHLKNTLQEERVQMQCFPLYSILKAVSRTTIDYLSLYIEGAEYEISNAAF